MDGPHQLEAVILLMIGVLALMAMARRLTIPYPIFLVLGGLALSFVPRVPVVHLDPDLDEVLHRLEQELDVEAMRIGLGEARPSDATMW